MKKASLSAAGGVLTIALLTVPAMGAEMDGRQLKKILKQADKQWRGGQVEAAFELYEAVLAATEPAAAERSRALYAVTLTCLAPSSPRYDPERGRALLAELRSSFPVHPQRLEIEILAGLLGAGDAAAEKIRGLEKRIATQSAAIAASENDRRAARSASASMESETAALRGELRAAERALAQSRAELESTREELAKKQADLEKVTKRLVGRSGGG